MKTFVAWVCILMAFFWAWEAVNYFFSDLRFVLPSPSRIAWVFWERMDRFGFHTWVTVKR